MLKITILSGLKLSEFAKAEAPNFKLAIQDNRATLKYLCL
jgi:hypothetical protein